MLSRLVSRVVSVFVVAASPLVAILVASGGVAAQTPGVVVTADRALYVRPIDLSAVVTATGLTACTGKTVELGLFLVASDPRSPLAPAVVDASGRASASVALPANNIVILHAGVTGDACVPGGAVVSTEPISVQELDAKQPTPTSPASASSPGPPSVGTGATSSGGGSDYLLMLVAGIVLVGSAGALVLTRRRPIIK